MRRTTLLLSLSLAATLALAGCGSSGSKASGPTGGGGLYGEGPTNAAGASSTAPSAAPTGTKATVMIARGGKLGDHLVDGQGRTLYLFTADHGLQTACTASCVSAWPPETAAAPTAGSGLDASKLTSVKGAAPDQVAYDGHLLYRYAGDTSKGDTNGTSIPQWYAVSPQGEEIEVP